MIKFFFTYLFVIINIVFISLFSHGGENIKDKKDSTKNKFTFKGTETFLSEYVGDNGLDAIEKLAGDNDNFWTFRDILRLKASSRKLDAFVRFDTVLFSNPPKLASYSEFIPGGQGYTLLNLDNDFRFEKFGSTLKLKKTKIKFGDFYINFGRGMALSLIKLDDIGQDNSLRGGRVDVRIPRKFKLTLAGGVVNSSNVDPLTHQVWEDDPLDKIAAARMEFEIRDALSLGFHTVLMQPRFSDKRDIEEHRRWIDQGEGTAVINTGTSLEFHLGGFHAYLEGNGQVHNNYRPDGNNVTNESGYAAFSEISYDLHPFNIKAEGIYYKRWLMEGPLRGSASNIAATQPLAYHHMVTLEPTWMVIKSFGNEWGGRLTGDLYLKKSKTQLKLSTFAAKYEGGLMPQGDWSDHGDVFSIHPILEVRQEFTDTGINITLEGGFRYEQTTAGEKETGTLWHTELDLSWHITGPHSIETKGEIRRHQLHVIEGNEYWTGLASLGYDWSGMFGITGIYEYSDQTGGSIVKIGSWELPLPKQHYMWIMATYHVPKPIDGLMLRFYGGSQRGGIKCAGGVCRNYPDAVGVKLEAIYRF